MLTFKDLEIGQKFSCNGLNNCVKKSSRTAYIGAGLWSYFGLNERVKV